MFDEDDTATVSDHEIARVDRDLADGDGHIRGHFDDTAARGSRGGGSGEHGEVVFARLVDVARRTVDDDAGNLPQLGAEREIAAPARGVNARALFHDNHVAWLRGFDGGGAEMPRSGRLALVAAHFDRDDAPRDPARGRQPLAAGDGARQREPVERVRGSTGGELGELRESVSHSTPGPPEGGHYDQ